MWRERHAERPCRPEGTWNAGEAERRPAGSKLDSQKGHGLSISSQDREGRTHGLSFDP